MKRKIKLIQAAIGVQADGVIGPRTVEALMAALKLEDVPLWPLQSEVRSGQSIFGAPGDAALVSIAPPYPLLYEGLPVRSIRVHKLVAAHVQAALQEVLDHYGLEEIHRLGLDQYGGSFNFRATTTGQALSMHAWGIALDFAPDTNAYSTRAPHATLSHPDCDAWWRIWEAHGAVSLGRERDRDWMHLQFARL
jgi:hypothetical protein